MTKDFVRPKGFKPKLGRLPRDPEKPSLMLRALAIPVALPVPPPELHNIELDPDTDMLGNDVWGDCVFVGIERNRRIAAAALGVKITWLTAANVTAKYKEYCGITTPPGPGAVAQTAYNWVRKTSFGWGGNHLLFYGEAAITQEAYRQACFEFQSVITCEVIRAAQLFPAPIWDHTLTKIVGGHATPGGTFTLLNIFLKTWGRIVKVTASFFANDIDEIDVLVWDFQWESLSYERQVTLIADLQALTGKVWTGPAPIPPTPTPAPTGDIEMKPINIDRLVDTRFPGGPVNGGNRPDGSASAGGLPQGRLQVNKPVRVQVTGKTLDGAVVPATTKAISGSFVIVGAAAAGNASCSASSDLKTLGRSSRINFPAMPVGSPNGALATGIPNQLLDANGGFYILSTAECDVVWDTDGLG